MAESDGLVPNSAFANEWWQADRAVAGASGAALENRSGFINGPPATFRVSCYQRPAIVLYAHRETKRREN